MKQWSAITPSACVLVIGLGQASERVLKYRMGPGAAGWKQVSFPKRELTGSGGACAKSLRTGMCWGHTSADE